MDRYFTNGTIPWVKSGELRECTIIDTEEKITSAALAETSVKLVRPGALLLAMYGATVGRIGMLGVAATTNQAVCHIVPDPSVADSRYLYYALLASVPILLQRRAGGAQPNISQAIVNDLEVPIPSLAEQRRIAEILDKADALRAKRRAALAQLDTLTQSIFLDMFGDPVRSPKWPLKPLASVIETLRYGPRFYNETYTADGVPIARITDLGEDGTLDFPSMPRLAVNAEDFEKFRLRRGDVIFARTGATVGKTAVVRDGDPDCIAGAYFIVMHFANTLEPLYVRSALNSPSIRAIVARRSRQAAQQNFSGPALRELPIPLAPLSVQRQYVARLRKVEQVAKQHTMTKQYLDALFASLQHRAFRGEL